MRTIHSATSIGSYAFFYCHSLTSATFLGNGPSMGYSVFDQTANGFTVYYISGNTGFTTPNWMGYRSIALIPNTPTITTGSSLPSGSVGAAYYEILAAVGGSSPYSWSVTVGSLPDGLVLSAAGGLSGTPTAQTNASFTIRVTDVNAHDSTEAFDLTISPEIVGDQALVDAIDLAGAVITGGGDAPWFAQSTVTHDGVDTARSGAITDNQESWLQTTVTGPGTVDFWWKVSSEQNYDFLEFYIDGELQTGRISGEVNWTHMAYTIASGSHTLRWRYVKDYSTSLGVDAAWLDQVQFTPPLLFDYSIANGEVTITAYNGPGGDVTIPDTIEGLPVTSIGDHAFFDSGLTSVMIPTSVTSIGADAFENCDSLASVSIPFSVTSIGDYAFNDSSVLTSATFLGNAPSMGSSVFDNVASGFTVYYSSGSTGFTSPKWMDYPAVATGGGSPLATWLSAYGLSPMADLLSTPNHDGVSLLMDYALALDPTANESASLPEAVHAGNQLSMSFYAGRTDVIYTVLASTDLSTWTTTGVTMSALDDNDIVTASVPASGSAGFLKLMVSH